jgi:hypothetical protein
MSGRPPSAVQSSEARLGFESIGGKLKSLDFAWDFGARLRRRANASILAVHNSGVARFAPGVVWRGEVKTWSHWKPGLRMAKERNAGTTACAHHILEK